MNASRGTENEGMSFDYYDIDTGEGITDNELRDRYDNFLDEVYGNVDIAGLTYATSSALKGVDPIAYRVGFSDWLDSELGETITDEPPTDEDDETDD